jgi:hypothetical protein
MIMKLNRTNIILSAVLAVQLVLGVIIGVASATTREAPRGPLLDNFTPDAVTQITIRDADKNEVTLAKDSAGQWGIAAADAYPVEISRVTTLLASLKGLDNSRLVAQTASSFNRLKVSDDSFERIIELKEGDQTRKIYVGTASGVTETHMRVADQDNVYLTRGLTTSDIPSKAVNWVIPTYFTVPQEDIASIKVENANGTFEFKKGADGNWTLTDLAAGETFNVDGFNTTKNMLGSISMTAPLGKTAVDTYGIDKPLATITVVTHKVIPATATPAVAVTPTATATGPSILNPIGATPIPGVKDDAGNIVQDTTYTLLIGAKLDSGDYVMKSSGSQYFVQIAESNAQPFVNMTRAGLLIVPPTATPSATGTATAQP